MMMMRRCGFLAVTLLVPFVLATESTYVSISGNDPGKEPWLRGKTSHKNHDHPAFPPSYISKQYHAKLGQYGSFELEISDDGSSMSWKSSLTNIDVLATELSIATPIASLNYHLHQQWTTNGADFATGGTGCGPAVTGGHYDPFFGCGPASAVPSLQCDAIFKPTSSYQCTPELYWTNGEYDRCEVGDLSGKTGAIVIPASGDATAATNDDPFAALVRHFVADRMTTTPNRFASIVFHNGGPRVLCGKLVEGKLPDDGGNDDEPPGLLTKLFELIFFCF
jgi:hypothetical protein